MSVFRPTLLLLLLGLAVSGHTAVLDRASKGDSVPSVVTDIAPVHSLVSQVLGDLGQPSVLIHGNANPHDFSLRPSVARSLAGADIVFMVGDQLTPWLEGPLNNLAADAEVVQLIDALGVLRLTARHDERFGSHDHGHQHGSHDDEHGDDHKAGSTIDPHAWLDPNNAIAWLDAIAAALSQFDKNNAAVYQQNADLAKAEIVSMRDQLTPRLKRLADYSFLVNHDSFHYFEDRFEIYAVGALAASDAVKPGPARVEQVRRLIKEESVACVLVEPLTNTSLIKSVAPSLKIVKADILGTEIKAGPSLYLALLNQLGASLEDCLR